MSFNQIFGDNAIDVSASKNIKVNKAFIQELYLGSGSRLARYISIPAPVALNFYYARSLPQEILVSGNYTYEIIGNIVTLNLSQVAFTPVTAGNFFISTDPIASVARPLTTQNAIVVGSDNNINFPFNVTVSSSGVIQFLKISGNIVGPTVTLSGLSPTAALGRITISYRI